MKMFDSNPELASNVFKRNPRILADALEYCPKVLSTVLRTNPAFMADLAHREPSLVLTVLKTNPDLLCIPLEANPSILAQYLPQHPELLTDQMLAELGFIPAGVREVNSKDAACQTDLQAPAQPTVVSATVKPKRKASLLDVVKKKKQATAWNYCRVMDAIARLLVQKCEADVNDDAAGFRRDGFLDFIQDFFLQETGLRSTAIKSLSGFIAGIKKFQDHHARIAAVGRLMGVLETSEPYYLQACDMYLQALQVMVPLDYLLPALTPRPPPEPVETETDELSTELIIPPVSVPFHNLPLVLERILDTDTPQYRKTQCIDRIRAQSVEIHDFVQDDEEMTMNDPIDVDLDLALSCIMESWIAHQRHIDHELFTLFEQADDNGDGVLTLSEFSALVHTLDPQCGARKILRMFKLCGEENSKGEHEIKKSEFAIVMRIYKSKFKSTLY